MVDSYVFKLDFFVLLHKILYTAKDRVRKTHLKSKPNPASPSLWLCPSQNAQNNVKAQHKLN